MQGEQPARVTDGSPLRREVVGRAAGNLEELLLDASETILTEETILGVRVKFIGGLFPGQSLWRVGEKLGHGFLVVLGFGFCGHSIQNLSAPTNDRTYTGDTSSTLGREEPLEGRSWQPTPVFLPGESHGQKRLAGCSPRGCKESDVTETAGHTCTPAMKA